MNSPNPHDDALKQSREFAVKLGLADWQLEAEPELIPEPLPVASSPPAPRAVPLPKLFNRTVVESGLGRVRAQSGPRTGRVSASDRVDFEPHAVRAQARHPAARRMAGFTGSLEGPFMRIRVASRAGVKLDSCKLYGLVRARGQVAFVARHLSVKTRERILRLGMIELLRLLPVRDVVAALTIRA